MNLFNFFKISKNIENTQDKYIDQLIEKKEYELLHETIKAGHNLTKNQSHNLCEQISNQCYDNLRSFMKEYPDLGGLEFGFNIINKDPQLSELFFKYLLKESNNFLKIFGDSPHTSFFAQMFDLNLYPIKKTYSSESINIFSYFIQHCKLGYEQEQIKFDIEKNPLVKEINTLFINFFTKPYFTPKLSLPKDFAYIIFSQIPTEYKNKHLKNFSTLYSSYPHTYTNYFKNYITQRDNIIKAIDHNIHVSLESNPIDFHKDFLKKLREQNVSTSNDLSYIIDNFHFNEKIKEKLIEVYQGLANLKIHNKNESLKSLQEVDIFLQESEQYFFTMIKEYINIQDNIPIFKIEEHKEDYNKHLNDFNNTFEQSLNQLIENTEKMNLKITYKKMEDIKHNLTSFKTRKI